MTLQNGYSSNGEGTYINTDRANVTLENPEFSNNNADNDASADDGNGGATESEVFSFTTQ